MRTNLFSKILLRAEIKAMTRFCDSRAVFFFSAGHLGESLFIICIIFFMISLDADTRCFSHKRLFKNLSFKLPYAYIILQVAFYHLRHLYVYARLMALNTSKIFYYKFAISACKVEFGFSYIQ